MRQAVGAEARPRPGESRAERRARTGRSLVDGWMLAVGGVVVLVAVFIAARALLAAPGVKKAAASKSGVALAESVAANLGKPSGADPTAVFAKMKGLGVELHFPAVPSDMVAVGYHQAYNVHGIEMVPQLAVHPKDKYEATKQALRDDPSLKLFLMMSRGRGSSEYSAADCAVKPGSLILAPVTGEVTLVKTYTLAGYGKDYQVEIKADGAPKVRVVLIHIKDVTVKAGERVEGGVSPIATVRHLTGIDNQVNRYLPVAADHTHVQINAVGYRLNSGS